MKTSGVTILNAIADPNLFAPWFQNRVTWQSWGAFLAALFALPMTPDQAAIYRRCTGRGEAPTVPAEEAWLICGRRAGKSFVLALVAVFLACFRDYRPFLAKGERATVLTVATDRRQARTIFRFVRGLLSVPMLARMIERETTDTFDLCNSVTIEVGAASYRSTRGYSFAAVLCDELAFWPSDEAAEPDYAILDAIRPGMATIPNAMLLCASSPYAKKGALFDVFKRYFGKNDPSVLVWRAPTRTMNPTVPQAVVDRAMERDPESAGAEYLAEFRSDVAAFIAREIVEAAVDTGVYERPPIEGVRYVAFTDPSGGASDSMSLAIAHAEMRVLTLDAVRERKPPFSPEAVVADFAELLRRYGINSVTGDRYGGEWPRQRFAERGVRYIVSERVKSDIYRDALPELNSRNVALLDNPRLVAQLCGLERRTSRGGRDVIDHAPTSGSRDDVVNSACGALLLAKPRLQDTIDIGEGVVQVGAGPLGDMEPGGIFGD